MQTTLGHKAQVQPVNCFDLHSPNGLHTEILNTIVLQLTELAIVNLLFCANTNSL